MRGDRGGLDGVVQIMPGTYGDPKKKGTPTQVQIANFVKGIAGELKDKGCGIPDRITNNAGLSKLLQEQVKPIYWTN